MPLDARVWNAFFDARFAQNFVSPKPMRNVINPQMLLDGADIGSIYLDPKSRDDIPQILRGLQHIVHVHRVRAENPSAAVAHGTGYKSTLNWPVQARVCAQPVGMARGGGSRLGGTVLSIQATTALCM